MGLVVNTGSMYAGKSTLLLSQGEKHCKAGQRVLYIKPSLDTRYSVNKIVTHDGESVEAVRVSGEDSILSIPDIREYNVVLIDEVQFFSLKIIEGVNVLLDKGVTVYVSGLDMDFLGRGFKTTMELMARADKVNKLKAVCECCRAEATHSYRVSKGTSLVELGEKESYIALCRKCYMDAKYKGMQKERG